MSLLDFPRTAAHGLIFDGFDAVSLAAGELEAVFVPELGMAGASLRHRGQELLDRRAGLRAYRDTGAVMGLPFLHPWANRLGGDTYELHGRRVRLPAGVTRDERGLPIHGLLAAHRGWVVESVDAGPVCATLRATFDFAADPALLAAFPFPHTIALEATLTEHELELVTTVTATGGAPVPISFGFHPYLRLPGVPREEWEIALHDGEPFPLGDRGFDDAFGGIEDGASSTASGGGRTISVRHHCGYPVAQVYSPPGAPFICFEPMTAPVDALRTGRGLRRAVPGLPFTAVFSIGVQDA